MDLYILLAASVGNAEKIAEFDYAALIVGILAFIVGVGGLIFSIISHISANKINLVINKREEWKEKLRTEATNFCTMVYAVVNGKNPYNKNIYEIMNVKTTIDLMLNINDLLDNAIKKLLAGSIREAEYLERGSKLGEEIDTLQERLNKLQYKTDSTRLAKHRIEDILKVLETSTADKFDDDMFKNLVARLTLVSATEVEFEFKCGLIFKARL